MLEASAAGLAVVIGECSSVGIAGGGAGNYGVVVSVAPKAHPDAITSATSFTIEELDLDYSHAWHAALPNILDSGTMVTYSVQKDNVNVYSLTGYNRTQADLEEALVPFIGSMAAMNVSLQPKYTEFDSYHDRYTHYYGTLPVGQFGVAGELLRSAPSARGSSDRRPRNQRDVAAWCSVYRSSPECLALRRPKQKSSPAAMAGCGRHVCSRLLLFLYRTFFRTHRTTSQTQ